MPFPNLDGRPSEYTEEIPTKVVSYIETCMKGVEFEVPTRAGLCVFLGITKQTLLNWAAKHSQLLDALEMLDLTQEKDVWNNALLGKYNSNIAKLMLANHGYSDKIQTDNTNTNLNAEIEGDKDKSTEEKLQEVLTRIKELQSE